MEKGNLTGVSDAVLDAAAGALQLTGEDEDASTASSWSVNATIAEGHQKRGSSMDEQDIAQELSQPGAQELLTSTAMARLAYNGADGFPRLIPIGFLWNGQEVIVCSATSSPKVRSVTQRPQVAVTIDVGDTPETAKVLTIRGLATVEIVDGVAEEYIAMSRKTMDPDAASAFESQVRSFFDQQARIAITPRWVRFFDFGAGRMPRFLKDLAERTSDR